VYRRAASDGDDCTKMISACNGDLQNLFLKWKFWFIGGKCRVIRKKYSVWFGYVRGFESVFFSLEPIKKCLKKCYTN
jgi:hypothetical protein